MLSTGLRSVLKQALTKPRLNKIKTSEVAETLPKPKVEEDLVFTPIKKVEETGDAASALAKEMGIDRDEILKAANIQANRTEIRSPKIVREAADALKAGKISSKKFREIRDKNIPPTVFDESLEAPSDLLMYSVLEGNKKDKIIGLTKNIIQDQPVGLRLDIPAYRDYRVFVPTVHDSLNKNRAIGHIAAAYLKGTLKKDGGRNLIQLRPASKKAITTATTKVSKQTGKEGHGQKTPFATIDGAIQDIEPSSVVDYAKKIKNSEDWVEVGFNPDKGGAFYNKITGKPVFEAEEVVQVGEMVLVKGARTPTQSQLRQLKIDTPKGPRMFSQGGIIERSDNYNTQRAI